MLAIALCLGATPLLEAKTLTKLSLATKAPAVTESNLNTASLDLMDEGRDLVDVTEGGTNIDNAPMLTNASTALPYQVIASKVIPTTGAGTLTIPVPPILPLALPPTHFRTQEHLSLPDSHRLRLTFVRVA